MSHLITMGKRDLTCDSLGSNAWSFGGQGKQFYYSVFFLLFFLFQDKLFGFYKITGSLRPKPWPVTLNMAFLLSKLTLKYESFSIFHDQFRIKEWTLHLFLSLFSLCYIEFGNNAQLAYSSLTWLTLNYLFPFLDR